MGGGMYIKYGVGDDCWWLGGFNVGKLEGWKVCDEGNDNIEVWWGVGLFKYIVFILGGCILRIYRYIYFYVIFDLWYWLINW